MFSSNYSTSLKHFKRLGLYKNSTGTVGFNPATKTGWSYRWEFLQVVDGLLVFNCYRWSVTTSGHQSTMRSLLRQLGIKIDIDADLGSIEPKSLSKDTMRKLYKDAFNLEIEIELATRKDSWTQKSRESSLKELQDTIEQLESKIPRLKLSQKEQKAIYLEAVESAMNDLSEKHAARVFKALCVQAAETDLNSIQL